MDDLAFMAAHGFEADLLADAACLVREMSREARESLFAARAVVLDIEDDAGIAAAGILVDNEIGKVLEGVKRLSVLADQNAEVVSLHVVDESDRCFAGDEGDGESHSGKYFAEESFGAGTHLGRCRDERQFALSLGMFFVSRAVIGGAILLMASCRAFAVVAVIAAAPLGTFRAAPG